MQNEENRTAKRLRHQESKLAEFGLDAFRADDLDQLLHRAAELVADGIGVGRAKVLELMPGGKELLVRAGVNWDPGVVGNVRFGADGDSPAGYALLHDEPVISRDLASETRFSIPDVLVKHDIKSMVNVLIAGENGPYGVLEVDSSRHRNFDDDDIAFLRNYANLLASAIERHRSHRALEEAMGGQKVLIQELEHRVKNMLALVQAIARQTTAEHPAAIAYRDAFVGRLQALARAEDLVFEDHSQELELQRLVQRSLEPFESNGQGAVTAEGESLGLPARNGRIVALVLHELGANATKHGALSAPEGKVRISWKVEETADGKQVRLRWLEEGGPAVAPSPRAGFGTRLLTTLAGYELDGQAQLEHRPEGLRYEIVFPVNT